MEKISFNKADSGNWAIDYKPSGIVNPDIVKQPTKLGASKVIVMKEKTELNSEPSGEKELVSDAEFKKREAELAQKLAEERLAQQKLLQTFYAEKARVELSPDQLKETMKALAERSIEQLMVRDGTMMRVGWKSDLHKISMEISVEAYDKLNEQSNLRSDFAGEPQA